MHTEESLNALNKAQLTEILETEFDAEVDKSASKADLIESILEFQGEGDATLNISESAAATDAVALEGQNVDEEAVAKAKAEAVEAAKDYHGKNDKKYRLVIHEQEGPDGRLPVTLSVNGFAFEIKRGKEVVVPERVIEALKNAVKTEINITEDGETIERDVPRFAYTVSPA